VANRAARACSTTPAASVSVPVWFGSTSTVLARTHKTLIWERTRGVQRLRHQLREYFPAALEAFDDLAAPDTLELLGKAPDPARARRLTRAQVSAALKRARRHDIPGKATAILAALRGEQLGRPSPPPTPPPPGP
jgi:hypothetical protein